MKITEFKIVQDKNSHPKLKEVQSFEYEGKVLNKYWSVANVFRAIYDLDKCSEEYMYIVAFNHAGDWLGVMNVAHGLQTEVPVDIKTIFTFLLLTGANKFILLHNHPSGMLRISDKDYTLTEDIQSLAREFGFDFLEHIILSRKGFALIIHEVYKYRPKTKDNLYPYADF